MQTTPVGWFASSLPAEHRDRRARAGAARRGDRRAWPASDGRGTACASRCCIRRAAEYEDRARRPTTARAWCASIRRYGSALLTGDIEAKSEALLLRARSATCCAPTCWSCRITGRARRRRRRSSAPSRPRSPSFACGYRNRFGHPRPDIVARYTRGVRWRAPIEGAYAVIAPEPLGDWRGIVPSYWMDVPQLLASSPVMKTGEPSGAVRERMRAIWNIWLTRRTSIAQALSHRTSIDYTAA